MTDKKPETLPEMMNFLRDMRTNLEKVIADSVRNFEETSGLTVEDVELIRNMASTGEPKSRVATVKITMRL